MVEAGWLGGTLPYMAPELLHGEPFTSQSDIWSLGVILYEMLTGSLPFSGHTLFELSMSIMVGKMEPLPQHMSPALCGIIRRCLASSRSARYYAAASVLRHLQSELASLEARAALSKCPLARSRRLGSNRLISFLSAVATLFCTGCNFN